MANYDIIGNIAIVKFARGEKLHKKKKFAQEFLNNVKNVKTILEKSDKFSGRLRTQKTKYLAGEKTKEALYRENGCMFRLNVETCYFSPRLASERMEIAKSIKKGEKVLVMFGGVGPFAIVVSKLSKASVVYSVELGRECSKYALENVKRNKINNVSVVQGDVRRVLKNKKEYNKYFDRIVMARPNLKDSFLDVAFPLIKNNGIINYYGFYEADKKQELINLINTQAKKSKRKIKIRNIKKAGEIGRKKYRFRADFIVSI